MTAEVEQSNRYPPTRTDATPIRVGILHGAGYAARDLIGLVLQHPALQLGAVTSDSHAGAPISDAHSNLRGVLADTFLPSAAFEADSTDLIFSCGRHGAFLDEISSLDDDGYPGIVVDLSANFRLRDKSLYPRYYDFSHPRLDLLSKFVYGLPERNADQIRGAKRIANPGCFATGVALSLAPLSDHLSGLSASIVALTGASGAGASPRSTTHFPERDGNVRAYSVWSHRHLPEIEQTFAHPIDMSLVPGGGPWTYGIWGLIHVTGVPAGTDLSSVYNDAYADRRLIRLLPGTLPELRGAARTPFCDIGWMQRDDGHVVIGFALDNLLKGASSAAIQNANIALGLPESEGILPNHALHNIVIE